MEYIPVQNDREQLEKLRSGEADAVLWSDLALEDDMRQIVRFSPNPFYFATTKGNNQLTARLSSAIAEISRRTPILRWSCTRNILDIRTTASAWAARRTYIRAWTPCGWR